MEKRGANVLITGGTGLLGSHLTKHLVNHGYEVAYLSRSATYKSEVKIFQWDIKSGYLEPGAIEWADYIVHLAGAGIADKPWSEKRKKVIRNSRVKSAELLIGKLLETEHHVKAIISSSAIGYYGDTKDEWVDENAPAGQDFMSKTAVEWEESIAHAKNLNLRVCILRTGIVLTKKGGALPKLAKPVRFFAGAPFGKGKQFLSWIHIDDLCKIYLKAIEDDTMDGVYNAVAPNPVTNKFFIKVLADVLNRPVLFPPIPKFILKLILGEMAETVLMSSRISNKKIIEAGFAFQYYSLKDALENIYKSES